MKNTSDLNIAKIIQDMDNAILRGDTRKADELTALLYRLQGGTEEDAVMPDGFSERVAERAVQSVGGQKTMSRGIKKIVYIAAAAVLLITLSVTALATDFFGIRSLVIGKYDGGVSAAPQPSGTDTAVTPSPQDLISLQGWPDSSEYKAGQEWNDFLAGYDTDHAILNKVGNTLTEFYDKYPMYNIYSQEMADKLEGIVSKYGLKLHRSNTIVTTADDLYTLAGTGRFITGNGNAMLGGYVYDDGTFHYDGQAVASGSKIIYYQLGNYVKGTFSDTYLNIGNADTYKEWTYKTSGGVTVSLALGPDKALVIADLNDSFLTVNVLTGTESALLPGGTAITAEDLQAFADQFDFSQISRAQGN